MYIIFLWRMDNAQNESSFAKAASTDGAPLWRPDF